MAITTATVHDADLQRYCALSGPGGLTPEKVRIHDPDALIALDDEDGTLTARASLWWNRVPAYPGERIGLIGHYAANDARTAALILSAACAELGRLGCTLAVGPMDGSTWRRYRLLTERGTEPPFFLEPDNPDDWPLHFEAQGFAPLARYYSALNEDIRRPWSLPSADGLTIRPLDPERIEEELHELWRIATSAFAGSFLYTPIEETEFRSMYRQLLPAVRPELVLIAEQDDQAAGFCFSVPDVLQARRGLTVDTAIMKTIAVLPEHQRRGLGSLLISRVNEAAARLGMRRCIHALMHEANPSRKIGRGLLRDFRCYTLFARSL
jgi:GNAT superfamily N-acetyltransferase